MLISRFCVPEGYIFHSYRLSRQLSHEGQSMLGEKTGLALVLCPLRLVPQSVMEGGRVGNTEAEDKVGAAFHCGGCSGGRPLLFIKHL